MYVLTSARIYYGNRSIPMERNAGYSKIPQVIESAEDIDLDDVAADLNRFVFNKGSAKGWELETTNFSPEEAAELEAAMIADGIKLKGPVKSQITVIGNGISLRWEPIL